MTRLYAVPLLLTLACATMHPRPVPDVGSGGSVPHANYLLQSIEGQATLPAGCSFTFTASAASGSNAFVMGAGARFCLDGAACSIRLHNNGSSQLVLTAGDFVPNTSDAKDLGTAGLRWRRGYFGSGLFDSSDKQRVSTAPSSTTAVMGTAADGASAVGVIVNTSTAYSTTGAKILSGQNNGAEKFSFDKDGALKIGATTGVGTVTLVAGSGTATTFTGAVCVCSDTSAAAACRASVSGTTLTLTGTGTDVIAYQCH